MEIIKEQIGEVVVLRVKGRLDGYWADHLAAGLADAVREGAHQIRLDLAGVAYLSSAGIRVLVQCYKQLRGIQGSFAVFSPSDPVKDVLDLAGLRGMLVTEDAPAAPAGAPRSGRRFDREGATFELFDLAPGVSMACRVIGDPERLLGGRFRKEDCSTQAQAFPDASFAVGLGALGLDFEDCRDRFGEFLSVAGAAAYQPTDGTNVPDYLMAAGTLIPDLKVLYGIACEGPFASMARFVTPKESGPATLTTIVEACLDIAGGDAAGIVMVAESAGLLGAALKRSPAHPGSETAPFGHPEVQEWLSFTPERAYPKALTLVAGVAARADCGAVGRLLRPLGTGAWPVGHFHAAAFSYRPLQKGELDLKATVAALFEAETPQGILHLLGDDRKVVGAGQSEFVRGACWIGPIAGITGEGG